MSYRPGRSPRDDATPRCSLAPATVKPRHDQLHECGRSSSARQETFQFIRAPASRNERTLTNKPQKFGEIDDPGNDHGRSPVDDNCIVAAAAIDFLIYLNSGSCLRTTFVRCGCAARGRRKHILCVGFESAGFGQPPHTAAVGVTWRHLARAHHERFPKCIARHAGHRTAANGRSQIRPWRRRSIAQHGGRRIAAGRTEASGPHHGVWCSHTPGMPFSFCQNRNNVPERCP